MPDTHIVDPLGRTVTLDDRAWHGHILAGHPEMKGLRKLVEHVLKSPDEIQFSLSDPDCRLYYRRGPRKGLWVMVVADVGGGFVKTAHLAKKITGGGREWSSRTP